MALSACSWLDSRTRTWSLAMPRASRLAALIVAAGRWDDLVEAVELGLTDWRDLLVAAFYANDLRGGTSQ